MGETKLPRSGDVLIMAKFGTCINVYRQEEEEKEQAGTGEDLCDLNACNRRLRATQSPNIVPEDPVRGVCASRFLRRFTSCSLLPSVVFFASHSFFIIFIAAASFFYASCSIVALPLGPWSFLLLHAVIRIPVVRMPRAFEQFSFLL